MRHPRPTVVRNAARAQWGVVQDLDSWESGTDNRRLPTTTQRLHHLDDVTGGVCLSVAVLIIILIG